MMMRRDQISDEHLYPLADLLSEITGIPPGRMPGFVVMVAILDEDGNPGGRILASTPNLRTVAVMLDTALARVGEAMDEAAGMS